MNPRQRRGVLLMVIAVVGALAVFASVLSYVASVNANVGNQVSVVTLSVDVKAYQPVDAGMLTLTRVPEKWLSPSAVRDPGEVVGLVPVADLVAGSYADRSMFTTRPGIAKGYRETAILVDAETGVGGKIRTGDRVDIIATFAAADQTRPPVASYVVQNAIVIEVGVVQDVERANSGGGFSEGQAIPVTFALPIADSLRLASAESFAVKVRLALRARNDESAIPSGQTVYEEGHR
ncbi:MAG: Flp pilus assembly protein CpaB [Propionicimonas sp.]|uniref:Flp pilus assembly protein CpaB n=1 Tax=Propionicimonas sp. TaxID=1955623 RepID=UPI002B20201E|nr:Flp pilus assembly protein CpaB [Propionicimonas sp.]MEA4943975.1 Flp pilus assembly protein CpaB [Propionicimonas sp.]MEA5053782.1 Flp pilus assembly protein CpaB [Propionicimonas sp.]